MSKTQNLIDAVKAGTLKIESNGYVYRRVTADHAFSGTKAGDWVRVAAKFRKDVIARAAARLAA